MPIQYFQLVDDAARLRIRSLSGDKLETQMNLIDDKLQSLLSVSVSGSILTVGPGTIQTYESAGNDTVSGSYKYRLPPLSSLDVDPVLSTLDLATGTVTGSFESPIESLSMTAGYYVQMGIELREDGKLHVVWGDQAATAGATTIPVFTSGFDVVVVNLRDDGTGGVWNYNSPAKSDVEVIVGGAGAGGGGVGDTTDIAESLKNQLMDSVYELLTPVVFKVDKLTYIDGSSSGCAYSYADKALLYSAASGMFVSTNMLDTNEWLNAPVASMQDVSQIDLHVYWKAGKIDTAAQYYVSRDGGNNYQAIPMTRSSIGGGAYYGTYKFLAEGSYATLLSQSSGASFMALDGVSGQSIGQSLTLVNAATITSVDLTVNVSGTPLGSLYVGIASVSGGYPDGLICESQAVDASTMVSGTWSVDLPDTALPPGNYYLVVRSDAVYKDHYTSAGDGIGLAYDASADGMVKYTGSVWFDPGTQGLKYALKGRVLDLRVKVLSSVSDKSIDGFGVFYGPSTGASSSVKNMQSFKFKSATDNLSTFALTSFVIDKDLCKVYWVEAGLCLVYPGFQISGNSIVFPTNTFYDAADVDVTLLVQQFEGSSFDNSDMNGALLTENHLGSSYASLDRSIAGRGILLKNANGVLREVALDADDNIVVLDT